MNVFKKAHALIIILMSMSLTGCTGIPDGVVPIKNFDKAKYLGKWYEIARLDHSFERGMNNVTAQYSMRTDGGIKVINRGYEVSEKEWKEAEGKAFFVNKADEGHLKVSFFGPFYGSYIIFELDKANYQYAFISGYNKSYLWLLARTPSVDEAIRRHFIERAKELGFATNELIFVEHDMSK